jgi:hypothetical protein
VPAPQRWWLGRPTRDVRRTSSVEGVASRSPISVGPSHTLEQCRPPLNQATRRELTMTPPLVPPALTCPSCDRALTYHLSQTGGVSENNGCSGFQLGFECRLVREPSFLLRRASIFYFFVLSVSLALRRFALIEAHGLCGSGPG